ncbi:efflux RND transporter periplasmic adaptor subunit [Desulfurivibrio alkaliphilus]|uniref:Efflux transporter, RND family, MFP subunit n=1 Tax=Desulfurivibrio alkaliphilus (strain DSM 19089 / UNIQEM U267 / AHT2) TaxID=589865 RepID=D6Z178_DESAT|nr:efflux RND transporter periplasmic adaptor subunit [Desulfurivibrio alkaliphilus]ADH85333.1 efflux transporter, RND family, MFP subunit [Desulfurivibrio alkaliphilus AHT 2]
MGTSPVTNSTTAPASKAATGKRNAFSLPLWLLILLVLLLAACEANEQQGPPGQEMPPPPVTLQSVSPQQVTLEGEYPARVHGSRRVEVRARVGGILEQRLYREGAMVAKDDPLFHLDREPYEIAWQQAKAELSNAEANLAQAEREWRRADTLWQKQAISERERDQALTNQELARARLALAQAVLADAARNLRYTKVTAPIAGITELEAFAEGSLLEPGTLLTTITSLDPVHIRFALPEDDAAALQAGQRQQRQPADSPGTSPAITLLLPDGSSYQYSGQLDFTAGTIDPGTGTVTARAVFANPDRQLVPGRFVRIRLTLEVLEEVFLIPADAITRGRNGSLVYVVGDDKTARAREVETGPLIGAKQVILSGLNEGDQLVVNGLAVLRDGMPVDPQPAEQAGE